MLENILIGAIGGAAYALNGLFRNKYKLDDKFRLEPIRAVSTVIVGGIIGAAYGASGMPESQILLVASSFGLNSGVKSLLKTIGRWLKERFG